jgi:predicted NUDIX family phosphoesterase
VSELILAVPRNRIKSKFLPKYGFIPLKEKDIFQWINTLHSVFLPRDEIEQNPDFKQIIPYVVLESDLGILVYERNSSEQRLRTLKSIGLGGHINISDKGNFLWETIQNGLTREVREEINLKPDSFQYEFIGIINEEISKVGHVHWGFVFRIYIQDPTHMLLSEEILHPEWHSLPSINTSEFQFEYWSRLTLELLHSI